MTLEEEDEKEEGRSGRSDYWDVVGCCHGQKGRTKEHTWDLKARTLALCDDGSGRGRPVPEGTPQMTSVGQKNNRSWYTHALYMFAVSSC